MKSLALFSALFLLLSVGKSKGQRYMFTSGELTVSFKITPSRDLDSAWVEVDLINNSTRPFFTTAQWRTQWGYRNESISIGFGQDFSLSPESAKHATVIDPGKGISSNCKIANHFRDSTVISFYGAYLHAPSLMKAKTKGTGGERKPEDLLREFSILITPQMYP